MRFIVIIITRLMKGWPCLQYDFTSVEARSALNRLCHCQTDVSV